MAAAKDSEVEMRPKSALEAELAAEISRREALEQQWTQTNQRMESALLALRAGTCLWSPDNDHIEWDDGFALLHGFAADQPTPTHQDIIDRIPSEQQQSVYDIAQHARDNQATFKVTYPVLWADGSEHWVHVRGTWALDTDGSTTSLFCIALDADERVQFEQQLADSERRLRDAQAAGGVGVWDFDIVNQTAQVSDEYLRMHGFEDANYSLKHYRKYVPEEDLALQREALKRASVPGGRYEVEHRIIHARTGEMRWVLGLGTGSFDEQGKLIRLYGTTQDITERKLAEAALLDSTRIFQTLTQASPTLIFRSDELGNVTFINDERWEEFSGRPTGAWRDQGWVDAFHEGDRARAVQALANATHTRSLYEGEFRWQHVDGEVRWLLFNALPVHGDEGFTGLVGTAVNVTALKTSEQERANLQLALADSQKIEAIGTLASGVAHDFNNLLAAVRGFLELATLDTDESSPATEYLNQALAALDQAKDVTAGLLTFARREPSNKQVFVFNDLVADNMEFLRKLVPASIAINTNLDPKEVRVSADTSQLRQVLVNLVINARDAMPNGGELHVELTGKNGYAILRVSDTGQGMDPATLKRVFEPFFTTKPHGRGTGLGLSIVHGIVKAHQGRVEIDSTPDSGTCVSVLVPLSEAQVPELDSNVPANVTGDGQTVMVVEDNPLVREACVLRLQASGFVGRGVGDGVEALADLAKAQSEGTPVQAVLLDVDLPGKNGVAVAREMRKQIPNLPVIYITGNIQNQALRGIRGEPVLPKPLDFAKLLSTLNDALDSARPAD